MRQQQQHPPQPLSSVDSTAASQHSFLPPPSPTDFSVAVAAGGSTSGSLSTPLPPLPPAPPITPACVWVSIPLRPGALPQSTLITNITPTTTPTLTDIRFEHSLSYPGLVKVTICRPEVHNAFRPLTLLELEAVFLHARDTPSIRMIILTGQGSRAFCSGGDQHSRGHGGYVGSDGIPRLSVLDLHIIMRRIPKVIIAMVAGYAIGGGHILHMVADLSIAASNARFGQTGPKVGSFDGGYGAAYMARIVGQKRAREIWFLCRQYSAWDALQMGLVNCVADVRELEKVTVQWCKRIMELSPTAIACLKAALNADGDGIAGLSQLAGEATRIFYQSEEGKEGRNAFVQKRTPRFDLFLDAEQEQQQQQQRGEDNENGNHHSSNNNSSRDRTSEEMRLSKL